MGYNPFIPSYLHIEEYRAKLQELIEFGGSDNEENIRPAFQNCLDAYCRDHRERLVLIPELRTSPSNKPDGTVKDSLRMARGYWEAKDSHDDLDAEIQAKFNRGYPTDNIIFEDSQTAVLVQNASVAMRVDMSRDGELHRLIRVFLDYELPEIQEFRQAQSQFKTDLPTVLENLRATVAEAEAENQRYQEAASAFLVLCRRTIGPAVSPADVREMLLQHILTKDIFQRVFAEDQFHRENNVARPTGRPRPLGQVPKRDAKVILLSVPCPERVPPLILRLVTRCRRLRSAALLSEGTAGSDTKTNSSLMNRSMRRQSLADRQGI